MSCNNSNIKAVTKETDSVTKDPETTVEKVIDSSAETRKQAQIRSNSPPPVSSEEIDSATLVKATSLPNNMYSPTHNIHAIKQELMEIRLRKARLEERKQMLVMEAEAARLKYIRRLKSAVNLSIQQAESRIIVAAARALGRSNNVGLNQSVLQSGLHTWPSSWQQNTSQLQSSLKHRQAINAQIKCLSQELLIQIKA